MENGRNSHSYAYKKFSVCFTQTSRNLINNTFLIFFNCSIPNQSTHRGQVFEFPCVWSKQRLVIGPIVYTLHINYIIILLTVSIGDTSDGSQSLVSNFLIFKWIYLRPFHMLAWAYRIAFYFHRHWIFFIAARSRAHRHRLWQAH